MESKFYNEAALPVPMSDQVSIRLAFRDGSVCPTGTPMYIRADANVSHSKTAVKKKTGMHKNFQNLFLEEVHLLIDYGVFAGSALVLKPIGPQ